MATPARYLLLLLPGIYLPVSHTQEQPASPSIARYESSIADLEAAQGPHAEELIEARQSLGLLLQQAGEHGRAVAALQQALQSVRVNEGLYSMSQIPILEAIIDSHAALGARDELRRNYEYLFWVYSRAHAGDRNAGLVPVIKKVGQWYFDLYNFSPPNTTVEPLIAADDLYSKALDILPDDAPSRDRADILYKVAVINHHVAEDVQDPMLSHREIREAMIPHGRITPFINETAVRQYYADQSFYKGKRSLNRIVETYEKTLPDTITEYVPGAGVHGRLADRATPGNGRRPQVSARLGPPWPNTTRPRRWRRNCSANRSLSSSSPSRARKNRKPAQTATTRTRSWTCPSQAGPATSGYRQSIRPQKPR